MMHSNIVHEKRSNCQTTDKSGSPPPPLTQQQQWEKWADECVEDSCIHPHFLENGTIRFVDDGERWAVLDLLNRKLTRSWTTCHPHQYGSAMAFFNGTGAVWQLKPQNPITDKKGKKRKYETPSGTPLTPFLPEIPPAVQYIIAARHKITDNAFFESPWEYVQQHPELPVFLTEGAKKSLCLLSHGFIAIGVVGHTGLYATTSNHGFAKEKKIRTELLPFCGNGAQVYIAMDEDIKPETIKAVWNSTWNFSKLAVANGATVFDLHWHQEHGKGVDDLIKNCGIASFEEVVTNGKPLLGSNTEKKLSEILALRPAANITIDSKHLPTSDNIDLTQKIIAILSAMGTGKTRLISGMVKGEFAGLRIVYLTYRNSLARGQAAAYDCTFREHKVMVNGDWKDGNVSLCVHSLHKVTNFERYNNCVVILDEWTKTHREMTTSRLCTKNRPAIEAAFTEIVKRAVHIIVADAHLTAPALEFLETLTNTTAHSIVNNYKPEHGKTVKYDDKAALTEKMFKTIAALPMDRTKKIAISCDSKKLTQELYSLTVKKHPEASVLLCNATTASHPEVKAFIKNPNIECQHYDVVIYSPTIGSGVSIDDSNFVHVFGFGGGKSITPDDVVQMFARVRTPCEVSYWRADYGNAYSKIYGNSYSSAAVVNNAIRINSQRVQYYQQVLTDDLLQATETINSYTWDTPQLRSAAFYIAERNCAQSSFGAMVDAFMELEGYDVQNSVDMGIDMQLKAEQKQVAKELQDTEHNSILNAAHIDWRQHQRFCEMHELTEQQQHQKQRFEIVDFYNVHATDLLLQQVVQYMTTQIRRQVTSHESVIDPTSANNKTAKMINEGRMLLDVPHDDLAAAYRQKLGLLQLIQSGLAVAKTVELQTLSPKQTAIIKRIHSGEARPAKIGHSRVQHRDMLALQELRIISLKTGQWRLTDYGRRHIEERKAGWTGEEDEIVKLCFLVRACKVDIKHILNIRVDDLSNMQIVGQLLHQIGVKLQRRRQRIDGQAQSIYTIDHEEYAKFMMIVEQRKSATAQSDPDPGI